MSRDRTQRGKFWRLACAQHTRHKGKRPLLLVDSPRLKSAPTLLLLQDKDGLSCSTMSSRIFLNECVFIHTSVYTVLAPPSRPVS